MKVKRESVDKIKNIGEQLNCFLHDLEALLMEGFFLRNYFNQTQAIWIEQKIWVDESMVWAGVE